MEFSSPAALWGPGGPRAGCSLSLRGCRLRRRPEPATESLNTPLQVGGILEDMVIPVRIAFQIQQSLRFQFGGKPRIVAPIDRDHARPRHRPPPEEIVHRIGFAPRIPARP